MKRRPRPRLSVSEVLAWADAHHRRTGEWPRCQSGLVPDGPPGENWRRIDNALRYGLRGLPGGSSLAQVLAQERQARNHLGAASLTEALVLAWADAHHGRTGRWPTHSCGPVEGAPGETWRGLDLALRAGHRSLPGGSSLARLLARERAARNRKGLAPLTVGQVLAWCDAHRGRTGAWPRHDSGPIAGAPGETWEGVDVALREGLRGLPGGSSLAQVLADGRGARNRAALPRLTEAQVLAWCDSHRGRAGEWPRHNSGPVDDAPGETWEGVNAALREGQRGLPSGSSLARLLAQERGARNQAALPRLTEAHVLAWAEAHRRRTGRLPTSRSGPVLEAPGETWCAVEHALKDGRRGLPGGSSLARLLAGRRGARRRGRDSA